MKKKKSIKKIYFSKMQSLGNDFMIINAISQNILLSKDNIIHLSDRHYGVGFDQLLIIEKTKSNEFDFFYRIFNADGKEVEQCGNGVRCFAHFVYMKQLTKKKIISIVSSNSKMICKILDDNYILVDMGKPNFIPKKIPFLSAEVKKKYSIVVSKNKTITCGVVSMGNPHCVIIVDSIYNCDIETLGPILEQHHLFPNSVNVGFMQIISRKLIKLRVYERGVGETRACGSGACAAVSIGIIQGLLSHDVSVILSGGKLDISWKGEKNSLFMSGPAHHVYDGCIKI